MVDHNPIILCTIYADLVSFRSGREMLCRKVNRGGWGSWAPRQRIMDWRLSIKLSVLKLLSGGKALVTKKNFEKCCGCC